MALPIHRLPARVGRAFVVEHRGVLTVIDSGTAREPAKLVRAIRGLGRQPEDVRQILISHGHGDHAGGAKRLRETCDAPVYAGVHDAEVIAGRRPYDMAPAAWGRAAYGWLASYPRFEVDHVVGERMQVEGGIEIVPAPGHTAGHLAFWAPDHQALFVGDAVWRLGPLRPSWPAFTQEPERNAETIRELAGIPSQSLLFGHGTTIRLGGRDRLRALVG